MSDYIRQKNITGNKINYTKGKNKKERASEKKPPPPPLPPRKRPKGSKPQESVLTDKNPPPASPERYIKEEVSSPSKELSTNNQNYSVSNNRKASLKDFTKGSPPSRGRSALSPLEEEKYRKLEEMIKRDLNSTSPCKIYFP